MGSPVIETVLHATLEKSRKKLLFAAVRANAFYSYAMASNKIEYEDSLDNKAEVKGGMGDESYPFELR